MGIRLKTVLRTIISVNQLSIHGAVSDSCEKYSACQTRTERPVLAGQSDPLFEPARLLMTIPTFSTEIPALEISLQKYEEQVERLSQKKTVWTRSVLMQDSGKQLKSDNTSWQNTLTSSYNLQNQWHVVSTLCHEMKNQLTQKVGFEGTPKLGPYWKSQLVTYKIVWSGNQNWICKQKTILTRGSEFLMHWTSWSQTWSTKSTTTTIRRPLRRRRKHLRWKRMYLLLQADPVLHVSICSCQIVRFGPERTQKHSKSKAAHMQRKTNIIAGKTSHSAPDSWLEATRCSNSCTVEAPSTKYRGPLKLKPGAQRWSTWPLPL